MQTTKSVHRMNSLGMLFLIFLLQLSIVSCGSTNVQNSDASTSDDQNEEPGESQFDKLQVISAVPVKLVGGEYVPVCRSTTAEPDGLQFTVLLQGTANTSDSGDRDISIKPFDQLKSGTVDSAKVTADLFDLEISCLESYPDDDLHQCADVGNVGKAVSIDRVDFFNYHEPELTNNEKVAVAVLMDISGSMNGLANPSYPFNEDSMDVVTNIIYDPISLAPDPMSMGTDQKNARYGALESFIKTLNDDDALILFSFNEYGIDVICEVAGKLGADKSAKLRECLHTSRAPILEPPEGSSKSALASLQGEERGRTPLWSAIEEVYPYMMGQTDESKSAGVGNYKLRHLLVIGDGPDTCAPAPEQNQCAGGCIVYSTSFETVRDLIEGDPMADRIPIHFVQMAANGYRERDPRQQEIACLTGGHHSFVNTLDIPSGKLEEVLTTTINRIRYTFRGYWRFEVPLTAVKDSNDPPPGWLYGLSGGGKVLPGPEDVLVETESNFSFKVNDDSVNGSNSADKRISFRKECDPDAASVCPASQVFNECSTWESWCDPQTLTCLSAQEWLPVGEESSCKPQDVIISLAVQTTVGDETETDTELIRLEDVETRCCHSGACMPPPPPTVPAAIAQPGSASSPCFTYDNSTGWVLNYPADPGQQKTECESYSDCEWLSQSLVNGGGEVLGCIANACSVACDSDTVCTEAVGPGYTCGEPNWLPGSTTCIKSCLKNGDCPGALACQEGQCRANTCKSYSTDECDDGYRCGGPSCQAGSCEGASDSCIFAQSWVYFSTLNASDGCTVDAVKPYLSKYSGAGPTVADWAYCSETKNCFAPPTTE